MYVCMYAYMWTYVHSPYQLLQCGVVSASPAWTHHCSFPHQCIYIHACLQKEGKIRQVNVQFSECNIFLCEQLKPLSPGSTQSKTIYTNYPQQLKTNTIISSNMVAGFWLVWQHKVQFKELTSKQHHIAQCYMNWESRNTKCYQLIKLPDPSSNSLPDTKEMATSNQHITTIRITADIIRRKVHCKRPRNQGSHLTSWK